MVEIDGSAPIHIRKGPQEPSVAAGSRIGIVRIDGTAGAVNSTIQIRSPLTAISSSRNSPRTAEGSYRTTLRRVPFHAIYSMERKECGQKIHPAWKSQTGG
jgi:hypothetical protein